LIAESGNTIAPFINPFNRDIEPIINVDLTSTTERKESTYIYILVYVDG